MKKSPSTDPTSPTNPVQPAQSNPPPPKGPIRTGAVVPALIIFVIAFVFFHFFFDWSLKRGLEWTGTHVYGAEVDIGSVKTSFLDGSIRIRNIEVTDKQSPALDFIRLGDIHFGFLWDALLRLKFVVNNAGINGIELYPPRTRVGWVKPPEPPHPASTQPNSQPSTADTIEQSVKSQVQNLSPGDSLSGLSSLLQGTAQGALLNNLQGGLKSEAAIKNLQTELAEKQKEWTARINALPQKKDFESIINRAKALKFDTRNPRQFAADLQTAAELKKELDEKLREVKGTTDALNSDVKNLTSQYKGIDGLVQQDVATAEAGLHVGNLDSKALTRVLFMNFLAQKLGAYAKYIALARHYLASKKSSASKSNSSNTAFIPHARSKGRTIRFPITTGYPLFWLKRADISSKATDSGFSGNISGALTNVTTDPALVGQPAVLDVKGDFPYAHVEQVHINVTIDHVHTPIDTTEISVGAYPVSNMKLVDSADLHLGLKQAVGSSLMRAAYKDASLNFQLTNTFSTVSYNVESSTTQVKQILASIFSGIPTVTLDATASGTLDHLDVAMNSNLGDALASGLSRYFQKQIDSLRANIQKQIEDKIAGPKQQLNQQIEQAHGQMNQLLGAKKAEVSQAQNAVTHQTSGRGSPLNKATDQLKKAGEKLLKGLNF